MANAYLKTLEEVYGGVSNIPKDVLEKAEKRDQARTEEQKNISGTEMLRRVLGFETQQDKLERYKREQTAKKECEIRAKEEGKNWMECSEKVSLESTKFKFEKMSECENKLTSLNATRDDIFDICVVKTEEYMNAPNKILEALGNKYGIGKEDNDNSKNQEIAINEVKNDIVQRMR